MHVNAVDGEVALLCDEIENRGLCEEVISHQSTLLVANFVQRILS